MSICALCKSEAELCKSHIIPEFAYKPAYDEIHRLIAVDPKTAEQVGYMQKGLAVPLLCHSCEQLINDRYEKPFFEYWVTRDALAPLREHKGAKLRNIPYGSFKLFHLSVAFRADAARRSGATKNANFDEVDLGPHYETIRKMLIENVPGPRHVYPIICAAISGEGENVWDAFIGPAHAIRLYGAKGFYFTFCGCQWIYIIASHEPPELSELSLAEDGTMPIVKMPLIALKRYRRESR